jgi:hypothetical protein
VHKAPNALGATITRRLLGVADWTRFAQVFSNQLVAFPSEIGLLTNLIELSVRTTLLYSGL